MKKIAITGNIACGKSLAFDCIKELGYPIIDCDDIVKDLYNRADIIKGIQTEFPEVIVNNIINFKNLTEMLFGDKDSKQRFENLIFPYVIEEFNNFFDINSTEDKVFVVIPLLFEADMKKHFDKIILIVSDDNLRKKRLIGRNSNLSDYFDKVNNTQLPQKLKVNKSDYVLENNGSIEEFRNSVINLVKLL